MAEAVEREGWLADFPGIYGVVPIVHGTGCGMSGTDEGYDTLFRTLAGYARNPNFGGILLLGLGCEVMQIPDLIGVTTERMMSVQHANRLVMLDTPAYQERTTAILTRNEDILPVIADEVIEAIGKRLND